MGANNLFLKSITKMFDNAVDILGIESGLQKQIRSCNNTYSKVWRKTKEGIRGIYWLQSCSFRALEPVKVV